MNKKENWILAIVLTIYTILGLIHSNSQGFWHDEIYTLTFLKGISAYDFEGSTLNLTNGIFQVNEFHDILKSDNFLENFSKQIIHEGHPPLYFVFLKGWSLLFGISEISLRGFSLFCGLLSIIFLFRIIKEYFSFPYIRWSVILFIVFNPFLLYFFTEARMYAFSFLFAIISFKYWLKYFTTRNIKYFWYFTFAGVALLYSHYYGLFFLSSLIAFDLFRNGYSQKLLKYLIPLAMFLPWGLVIKQQTTLHNVHWTDGSFSFWQSIAEFSKGMISLLFSPVSNANILQIILGVLIISFVLFYSANSWKKRYVYILLLIFYFSQIFLFDQLLDHHTIAVPRYFIFLLIFFFFTLALALKQIPKKVRVMITLGYCILAGYTNYKIVSLSKAPKQMYREVASYIDSKHNPENTIIVVEPEGALTFGLIYYLNKNFTLIPAERYRKGITSDKAIFVDENLGVPFRENKLHKEEQKELNLIPFVGVYLYE